MKTAQLLALALACMPAARADFSYTQTRKPAQGAGAAMGAAAGGTTKHFLKGAKMKTDSGTTATIMDFESQTVTLINHTQKTYTVTKFSDMGQALKNSGAEVKVDVQETGQRKSINGFNASQVVMTMSMEGGRGGAPGMKMQMEMEMWLSSDVPGAQESRAFFQKYGDKLPWAAMGAGGDPSMQKAMGDMMKKVATLGGVPVVQITRMKMAGGNDAQSAQMNAAMQQAMARIEEMKKQGGKQAEMAEQLAGRMGGARGGAGGGSLFEITSESSGFSNASIPDSVFAIPDGYQKK